MRCRLTIRLSPLALDEWQQEKVPQQPTTRHGPAEQLQAARRCAPTSDQQQGLRAMATRARALAAGHQPWPWCWV